MKLLDKVNINELPVTIVNCRYLKPMDETVLSNITQRNMKFICYETDALEHGLGSMILEWCNDHDISISLKRFGIPDDYIEQGSERLLRKDLGIDLNTVMDCIQSYLEE